MSPDCGSCCANAAGRGIMRREACQNLTASGMVSNPARLETFFQVTEFTPKSEILRAPRDARISRVLIACCKSDVHLARICVASVRFWNPEIPVFLIKDSMQGAFSTTEI